MIVKKLILSALLTGTLLGTSTPVLAQETITGSNDAPQTGNTTVHSDIQVQYIVTIPSELNIDLMSGAQQSDTDFVTLEDLTSAGQIDVTVDKSDLILEGLESEPSDNQVIPISVVDEESNDLQTFSLNDSSSSQSVAALTTETSQDNLPGTYNGEIVFNFNYAQ